MQTAQGNMLVSLQGVKAFLDAHADRLDAVVNSGTRAKLLAIIDELNELTRQQTTAAGAAKNATRVLERAREVLILDHMNVVSRIGATELRDTPELANLRMPRGRPSTTRLAAAAQEMAHSAEAQSAVFVAAGLAPDFAAQLSAAADAMLEARQQRTERIGARTGATTAMRRKLSAARKLVLVLDSMVKTAVRGDPRLLGEWNYVKRVARVGGGAEPANTTPAPAPAAAA